MAEADRRRLLERALALPRATPADFFAGRRPPDDADPEHLRRIDDTTLRTKLVDAGIAEGLQSPKGPQRIASIIRIYPDFDAPSRKSSASNGRAKSPAHAAAPQRAGLPSVEEMERLLQRVRDLERSVGEEVAAEIDARIATLKRSIADLDGEELESAYRELGDALERKRAQAAQTRFEVFRRIEADASFAERPFLRFLRR
jgi:hypothetical protein